MKLDRVMIAAPKSGSGKTTITCAILQTLKDMGASPFGLPAIASMEQTLYCRA